LEFLKPTDEGLVKSQKQMWEGAAVTLNKLQELIEPISVRDLKPSRKPNLIVNLAQASLLRRRKVHETESLR
jgi:hypothetical protein